LVTCHVRVTAVAFHPSSADGGRRKERTGEEKGSSGKKKGKKGEDADGWGRGAVRERARGDENRASGAVGRCAELCGARAGGKTRQAGQQAGPRGVRASASAWGSRRVGRAKQGRPGRGRKKAGLVLELGQ